MVTKGPIEPAYRRGKCMHDPALESGGPSQMCGMPAALHLLIEDPDERWSTYACDAHEAVCRSLLPVLDSHQVADACLVPGSHWQFGAVEGEGFCFDPDDELDAAVEALALGLQGVAL